MIYNVKNQNQIIHSKAPNFNVCAIIYYHLKIVHNCKTNQLASFLTQFEKNWTETCHDLHKTGRSGSLQREELCNGGTSHSTLIYQKGKKLSSEDSQRYHDLHKTEVEVFCEGKNCATGVGNVFHTFHIHISTGISWKSDAGR
jgi:hypothetical protein